MPTELVAFKGSQFVGKVTLVDSDFVPALEKVNKLAKDGGIKVHVTSATRQQGAAVGGAIVMPASRSNHLIGHAIDMNLVKDGKFFNSDALFKKNKSKWPAAVKNFIEGIRKDKGLRWGGDFGRQDPVHIDDAFNIKDPLGWEKKFRIIQTEFHGLTRPSAEPGKPRLLMLERPMMRGPDVHALQERLVELGFEMIPDGQFGPLTDSAVTVFQERNGLEPDGIVGSDTRETLKLKS